MPSGAYYNEFDPGKAEVLRELIRLNVIAPGEVDTRSIKDVTAGDVRGYIQCHWFAGIGIWSYAARCAGWSDTRPMWSGSCPCPSFSSAGKGTGFDDPRHLWPDWSRLIAECRPAIIFGEQADDAVGYGWIDLVQANMEAQTYAVGPVILGAHSVGAPHIRQRLYFFAVSELGVGTDPGLPEPQGRNREESGGLWLPCGESASCGTGSGTAGSSTVTESKRREREQIQRSATGVSGSLRESESLFRPLPCDTASSVGEHSNGSGSQPGEQSFETLGYGRSLDPASSSRDGLNTGSPGLPEQQRRWEQPEGSSETGGIGDGSDAPSARPLPESLGGVHSREESGRTWHGQSQRSGDAVSGSESMHPERWPFNEPRFDGRDGQNSGRTEAYGEPGAHSEVCGDHNPLSHGRGESRDDDRGDEREQPDATGITLDGVATIEPGLQERIRHGGVQPGEMEPSEGQASFSAGDLERDWRGPGWLDSEAARSVAEAGATRGFWAGCDWWYGRDGKYRPAQSSLQRLADGITGDLRYSGDDGAPLAQKAEARVLRLKCYGDGIVAPLATEFIKAAMAVLEERND